MKRELAADVQAQLDAVQIQNGPNNIREVLKETNSSLDLNGSLRDFVNQINQLSSLGRGAAAQYKGKLFEWMVVAAACIAQGLVGDSLKEAIAVGIGKASNISGSLSSMFLGDTATAVTYDPKDFISSADLSSVLSSNYSKIGELYVANKASKDKVDVQISLPSGMGKVLNLSIKNKNLISQHAQPVD